ncbi:MAG: sulfonate ABC transporter permease [Shackletoniella antarctica]|uniref:Dolichol-phosphate mannosyltransferase n=1 Tax=Shackletoniella antarctica TaxID=268115 RepID=A0A2W4WFC9_9CYAN|nr:MAG: sulfonate ABC transporter permease [Shackletoniella antarctica]
MIPQSQLQKLESCPSGPLQILPLTGAAGLAPGENGHSFKAPAPKTLTLSVAIPTYNEGKNIGPLIQRLTTLLDGALPHDYELIVVDDNSSDLTWQQALALTATYPQLRVIRRRGARGLSSAVIRGWQGARGQILAVIDADLQHPPEVLIELLGAIQQGADLAVGSRHVEGGGVSEWSLARRVLSRGAQTVGLLLLPRVVGRVSDPMSGYFMVRRSAIAGPLLNPKGYKILLEVLGRGGIDTIAEVGYVFQERQEGASKVTWRQYIDYIHHLLRLRLGGRLGLLQQRFPTQRFVRFGLVGLSGVVVDMVILYLLHSTLGLPLTRSKIFAAEVAILNNFIWNDAWTFADVSMLQKGWSARLKRFFKFNLVCLAGLVLNVLLLNVLYNLVFGQRWAYAANLMAIAIVTFWNFWLNLKLSWRVTQVK